MENLPIKMITTPDKVHEFQKTDSQRQFIEFVIELQQSVLSKNITDTPRLSDFSVYDDYFKKLKLDLDETPPVEGKNRFGNIAFKTFYDKANEQNRGFVINLLKHLNASQEYAFELKAYLDESFGDRSRVDYGTGHELNFMIFLFCVNKIKPFQKICLPALVHQVFYDYIFLMRKVQLQYNLEPAGSHGVWGLDDYHFLPFIFGGAELVDNQIFVLPSSIHNTLLVEQYKDDYMYLNCIWFICHIKKGVSFGESSPILNDVSAAASWLKVANGMVKMFCVEVLGKYPVVQHIKFGRLFEFK